MRLQTGFILTICCMLSAEALAAPRASRSAPKKSSNSTLFFSANGGYSYLGGSGIEKMNSTIYSSPLLEVDGTFGSSQVYGAGLTLFDQFTNQCFMVTGSTQSESSSASAKGMGVNATLRLTEIGFLAGARLVPFQKAAFTFSPPTKVGRKFSDRLMLLGYAGLEYLLISHSYSRHVESSSTDIEYRYSASHFGEKVGLRLYYSLFSKFQLFADTSFLLTQRIAASSHVEAFKVSQQDLRYRSKELGVDEMAASPVKAIRMDFGLSFAF